MEYFMRMDVVAVCPRSISRQVKLMGFVQVLDIRIRTVKSYRRVRTGRRRNAVSIKRKAICLRA